MITGLKVLKSYFNSHFIGIKSLFSISTIDNYYECLKIKDSNSPKKIKQNTINVTAQNIKMFQGI